MGSLAVLTMDVELAQHMQAAPKKYSVSRMLVALAAAVAASAATAYAVQHKNRLGDRPASLQRRLWNRTIREELPDIIVPPEELGDSIHEDSWTCLPASDDCDLDPGHHLADSQLWLWVEDRRRDCT